MRMLLTKKGFSFKLVGVVLLAVFILGYAVYAANYGGSVVENPDGKALKTVRVTGILDFNPQAGQVLTISQLKAEVISPGIVRTITGTCKTGELAISFIPTAWGDENRGF